MKQLWIILAFAVQAMCCGSGWAFDINGPLGPGGGGIFGDGGTNPGITDDCQCSYLMVVLSPFCQDLNAGCTITGKVIGITYGGSCDVLLTLRTYPTNVLQFVTNAIVDGINTEFKFDFLSVTNSCSAEIIETNFVVRGLTHTPEGQFSGLIAELYKCGDTNPCLVYTQKLDVVQLQGISVSPQVAQVNEDVIFTAQMSPTNSGGSILNWSGGGQPETGTGTVFTTRWLDLGTHTVTAQCGINSECAGTTSVNVPVVPSLNLEYNALPEETQPTPHEENPGGFICLNDDDDDGETGIDKDRLTTAPELAVADSDLKEVKLSMTPVPTTGIMTLTVPSGIRVWENAKKKSLVANQWNLAVPGEKTAFEALLAGGIWLEGTNSGSGDLKLAYGTACADKIKMTVLKVDLDADVDDDGDVDETDESKEESPGAIVFENWDNDDGDTAHTPDKDETSVTGENDLVPIYPKLEPTLTTGTLKLEATAGGTRVKVWASTTKTTGTEITLPKKWNLATETVPATLYLEGYDESTSANDVELKLNYANGGTSICDDKLRITVVRRNLGIATYRALHPAVITLIAVLGGQDLNHAGLITDYTGKRTKIDLDNDANWQVTEMDGAPFGDSCVQTTLQAHKALASPHYGYYSVADLPDTKRNHIVKNGQLCLTEGITYTWADAVDGVGPGLNWDGTIGDIASLRCDGLVEVCYELPSVAVWGANGTHYLIQIFAAEHNYIGAANPQVELSPIVQRGGVSNSPTRFVSAVLYQPNLP